MLIPSIDLMDGKIVQLVQGAEKALEFENFQYWIERFSDYPLVQLIDLDAAMGSGSNHELASMICKLLPCQVGGGIRDIDRARELMAEGAKRIIVGTALFRNGNIDSGLASHLSSELGSEKLTFAIDTRGGKVSIKGWKEDTSADPLAVIRTLDSYCSAFLYTHIDTEGTMTGFPMEVARRLRGATSKRIFVAGGIRSLDEVTMLDKIGVDAVVGMAIYKGAIGTK